MSEVKTEEVVEKKSLVAQLEEEGDVAADYLEGLLSLLTFESRPPPESLIRFFLIHLFTPPFTLVLTLFSRAFPIRRFFQLRCIFPGRITPKK